MPSTNDLIKVMKKSTKIQKVEITKDIKVEQSVWLSFKDTVYRETSCIDGFDYKITKTLIEFMQKDSLELVNKQGKILKRVERLYKEMHGEKLESSYMGKLGDWLQYFMGGTSGTFYVDFTDVIDWRDGQFGKEDSCWWGCYRSSIPTFQQGGGWGIRFYSDENQDNDNGIGRCWIFPKDGVLLCFNAYGVERAKVSKVLKKVFADHGIILHYKRVGVHNSYSSDIPYINSDSNSGSSSSFCMYPEPLTESDIADDYNLHLKVIGGGTQCYSCDDFFNEDDITNIDGLNYCDECRDEHFSYCHHCNCYEAHSYMNVVRDSRYDELCNDCIRSLDFNHCESCNRLVREEGNTAEDTGNFYCDRCTDRKLTYCDDCQEYYEDIDEHTTESHPEEEVTERKSIMIMNY